MGRFLIDVRYKIATLLIPRQFGLCKAILQNLCKLFEFKVFKCLFANVRIGVYRFSFKIDKSYFFNFLSGSFLRIGKFVGGGRGGFMSLNTLLDSLIFFKHNISKQVDIIYSTTKPATKGREAYFVICIFIHLRLPTLVL